MLFNLLQIYRTTAEDNPEADHRLYGYWPRMFVSLPAGVNQVYITGERSSDPEIVSGVSLDDLKIWPCQDFSRLSLITGLRKIKCIKYLSNYYSPHHRRVN